MTDHPLDRPVWNALTTRQAALSVGDGRARRYRPEINLFAAGAEPSEACAEAIGRFLADGGPIGLVEAAPFPAIPGGRVEKQAIVNQMVATASPGVAEAFDYLVLGGADAAEMLALATLTAPGPFFAETHRMGYFIGVREGGRLVAMAGQRMRVPGFTEVSAVCTHPEFRGRGYAGKLMRVLIERIVREGDAAFLHVYPDNAGAIGLYEALGFRLRAEMMFTVLAKA
ncbi:putative acetyltransferase [Sphingomonas changbaiensis NBRC 104936]|uniref:Putative acetyltransferase n=1 Tax=Sphingomonas changbaiensis NBRC 104936 TaxID=1219043 RepID=A0A0E9MRK5_9SPHN|nr:GNAT family N-acetyltransferase [Sphingomonas changbaiensis]GAO40061.1 putative acetyltransferase [Sphingomonas changbaiensis NBRC 104936]